MTEKFVPSFYYDLIVPIIEKEAEASATRSTWISVFCEEFIGHYERLAFLDFTKRRKFFKTYCDFLDKCRKYKHKTDLIKQLTDSLETVYPYDGYEHLAREFNSADFDTQGEFLEYLKKDPSNAEKFTVRQFMEFAEDYISGKPIPSVDWSYACKPFTVERCRY